MGLTGTVLGRRLLSPTLPYLNSKDPGNVSSKSPNL